MHNLSILGTVFCKFVQLIGNPRRVATPLGRARTHGCPTPRGIGGVGGPCSSSRLRCERLTRISSLVIERKKRQTPTLPKPRKVGHPEKPVIRCLSIEVV
jgi:hypothetical protein